MPRDYRPAGRFAPGSEEAVARLDETLTDYRATVRRVAAEADVAAAVAAFLEPAATVVAPPGLPDAWLTAFAGEIRRDDPPLSVDELDHLDAVVTGAAVAIADTGTFVLDSGAPDQGRRAITLVPDHHVCVIRAVDVVVLGSRGRRPPGPDAAADLRLRALGHQRHRARPGRGGPRSAPARCGARRCSGS